MRIKSKLVAAAAIATFGAGSAFAQGMPSTPSAGPSSSSPSAASPSTPAAGGSGYLTAPDRATSATTNAGDKFGKLDKDHDGMISKAEARSDKELRSQFDKLDVNKDGKLDQSEFAQFEEGSASNQTIKK